MRLCRRLQVRGTGGAAERKTSVGHTVAALPILGPRAYVSSGRRTVVRFANSIPDGFANPPPRQRPSSYTRRQSHARPSWYRFKVEAGLNV